jgi:hypothetical protein
MLSSCSRRNGDDVSRTTEVFSSAGLVSWYPTLFTKGVKRMGHPSFEVHR